MRLTSFRQKIAVCAAVAALGFSALSVSRSVAADKAEDSAIAVIMKKGFKSTKTKPSIVKKAIDGTASKEELNTLLGYCKDLQKQKPPKGEQKDWDEKISTLTKATEALIKGDSGAADSLKAAANCKECHKVHQPDT
jgi:hypothetical protein